METHTGFRLCVAVKPAKLVKGRETLGDRTAGTALVMLLLSCMQSAGVMTPVFAKCSVSPKKIFKEMQSRV